MELLNDFDRKPFVEQINILETIASRKMHETIDQLFRLCETQAGNDALVYMIRNTLKTLLLENEEKTVEGLSADDPFIRKFCTDIAGQRKYVTAAPHLIAMAKEETQTAALFEQLSALADILPSDALDLFRRHSHHSDPLISALSIEMLGTYNDTESVKDLCGMVVKSEMEQHYEECDLATAKAIWALGKIRNNEAVAFMASRIHHRNPTARRLIHQELVRIGDEAVNFIAPTFEGDSADDKIMAANILGQIGTRDCAEVLVRAFDKGAATDANIRFAVYEALGRTRYKQRPICLAAALDEEEELVLMAVVMALDDQLNETIENRIMEIASAENAGSDRLLRAVVAGEAFNLFKLIYYNDRKLARRLVESIMKANDQDLIQKYRIKLEEIGDEMAKTAAARLGRTQINDSAKSVLTVDDSRAMLNFYRSALSSMNLIIISASNGKEGMELIESGCSFDIILSDMNMPVMDGIEFTRKVREKPQFAEIPIVMVTTESEKSQTELARKAGVNHFLTKPFTPEAIREVVNRIF